MSSNIYPLLDCFLLVTDADIQQSEDWLKLGFLDYEKINGIPNFVLPLILEIIITDRNLTWFLIDDGIYCNVLYTYTMDLLGIQKEDMSPYSGGDLLEFNYSITYWYLS